MSKQRYIGCHLSSSGGYLKMGETASSIGGNTFAFFTRNPRGGKAKAINEEDVAAFNTYAHENAFGPIVAHAPYTLNPAAKEQRILEFAHQVMADDLLRMENTPHQYYNFHPGSHVGQGEDVGCSKVSDLLNAVLQSQQTTTVLLETMAGKGTELGTFHHIARIINDVDLDEHVGVCLDTCHIWDAGHDIKNNLEGVLEEFDRIIGLDKLKAIHLNDSLNECGAHKDRHAKLGEGCIGFDALAAFINHPLLQNLPFILETPNELPGYQNEISRLRSAVK